MKCWRRASLKLIKLKSSTAPPPRPPACCSCPRQPAPLLPAASVTCNVLVMPSTSRERVQEHRRRLRAQGLRPVQIWVPDVNATGFAAAAHAQSVTLANGEQADDDQAFVDDISDSWDE